MFDMAKLHGQSPAQVADILYKDIRNPRLRAEVAYTYMQTISREQRKVFIASMRQNQETAETPRRYNAEDVRRSGGLAESPELSRAESFHN